MPDSSPMVTPAQRKWLPWLTAVGFFMQTLDGTILNTALPSMAEALGESPLQMQSVIIAYMLTVALLIPASGWLADRFGTRRVYLAAILLFTLGSLACAAATNLPSPLTHCAARGWPLASTMAPAGSATCRVS